MLRWALASLTLVATVASAQVSGTASVVSDYRYRGVALSQGDPAAQLDVGYDFSGGLYAGAFASNAKFYSHAPDQAQLTGYGGYAWRLERGWSVDAGASFTDFTSDADYRFVEVHTGIATESVSARLYYSPNYFGGSIHTVYAELNGSYRLFDQFKLIGHAGLLKAFSGATDQAGGNNPHADWLAGGEYRFRAFTLQVSRVFSDGASLVYPISSGHTSGVLTARLSFAF
ncbi:MAG TPA: TorF family putative porin [Burkholderiaceae bacterium]|nr:TorF family putative porin [Burkholderiaceae bacterium]